MTFCVIGWRAGLSNNACGLDNHTPDDCVIGWCSVQLWNHATSLGTLGSFVLVLVLGWCKGVEYNPSLDVRGALETRLNNLGRRFLEPEFELLAQ